MQDTGYRIQEHKKGYYSHSDNKLQNHAISRDRVGVRF